MKDQLLMFDPTTCDDTTNAISSQVSESGHTPCGSPDGPTTAKSGPARAPASRSAQPAKAKRSTTKGIFGQSGFLSSKHDDLSFALASKYRALTDSLGSTLFEVTWMMRNTPMGFSIPAQRASEARTEDNVCIGWPSPQAHDVTTRGNTMADGHYFPHDLSNAALMASWPTPQSSDMSGGGQAKRCVGRANLNDFAILAGWPTARATDAEKNVRTVEGSAREMERKGCPQDLSQAVSLTSWGTPAARDWKSGDASQETLGRNARRMSEQAVLTGWATPKVQSGDYQYGNANHALICLNLSGEARLTAFGDKPIGFLLARNGWEIVPACGQLNAGHSRWLMGLPSAWDACAVMAMASWRSRRRRS